jgi:dsRNA-specific ribonuclease
LVGKRDVFTPVLPLRHGMSYVRVRSALECFSFTSLISCVVNGSVVSEALGGTKKAAKDEAARLALEALGDRG